MSARKNLVIIDDDNESQELTIFVNTNSRIFLEVYKADGDVYDRQFITLDISDAELLIQGLKACIKELK